MSRAAFLALVLAATPLGLVRADAPEPAEKPEPTYELRYDFSNVPAIHYEVLQKAGIVSRKGDAKDVMTTAERTRKHFRVISVDKAGNALLESKIDHAQMAVQFDDAKPIHWDSANKDEDPPKQFRDVSERVGRPLARLRVSPRGELVSMTHIDARGRTKKAEPEVTDNVLVAFPEKPLRVGDTWSEEFEVEVNVARNVTRKARLRRTFELASVEGDRATITYEIAVLDLVLDPSIGMQLIQRTPSGSIVFNMQQGRIVSKTQSLDERVFGPFGPGSLMHAWSNRTERIIEEEKPVEAAAVDR